jgi:hypothetical protein
MLRRRFLLLTMATLIGATVGKSRLSPEARRKDEPPVSLTREQRLAMRRIDDLRRELAARNRQLELAHRSFKAELELARVVLAQLTRS